MNINNINGASQSSNTGWLNANYGSWLSITPSKLAWDQLRGIQDFVGEQLRERNITEWVPYSYNLAHASVFLGFSDQVNPEEKRVLMNRIADKIAHLPKFHVNVKDAQLEILGRYITLHFNSEKMRALNEAIRNVIKECINSKEFNREHLYKNGGNKDKLENDIDPHFTVGIIDVEGSKEIPWEKRHKDIRALANKSKNESLIQEFNEKYSEFAFSFPVNDVKIIGLPNPKAKVGDKNYVTLETFNLGSNSRAPNPVSSQPIRMSTPSRKELESSEFPFSLFDLKEKITKFSGTPDYQLESGSYIDKTGTKQNTINVMFEEEGPCLKFVQYLDKGSDRKSVAWKDKKTQRFKAGLGLERLKVLYDGSVERIFKESTNELNRLQELDFISPETAEKSPTLKSIAGLINDELPQNGSFYFRISKLGAEVLFKDFDDACKINNGWGILKEKYAKREGNHGCHSIGFYECKGLDQFDEQGLYKRVYQELYGNS